MSDSTYSAAQALLRGVAWLMFVIAGLSFWFSGRLIAEFAKIDRTLGEMGGIGIAVVCVGIGAIATKARREKHPTE
jgi:hypothetical protein